jgi:hypothetical protein
LPKWLSGLGAWQHVPARGIVHTVTPRLETLLNSGDRQLRNALGLGQESYLHAEDRTQELRARLFAALMGERQGLVEQITVEIRDAMPSYAGVPRDDQFDGVLLSVTIALRIALTSGPSDVHAEFLGLPEVNRRRADQGVSVSDLIRSWSIGVRVLIERTRTLGRELGLDDAVLLDFAQSMVHNTDRAHEVIIRTLGDVTAPALTAEQQRSEFVVALARGELPPSSINRRAGALGFDPARPYFALRARTAGADEADAVRRGLLVGGRHPAAAGSVTTIDGDLIGFVTTRPVGDLPGVIGLGPARPLDRLADSLRIAARALETAVAFELSGVHDLLSLGVRPAIAADEDIGNALVDRYLQPVLRDQFGDELVTTVLAYFEADMHVRRAAGRMFMHPNTMRYRIARFETLADADLRDQRTAIEVWWALSRHALARPTTEASPENAARTVHEGHSAMVHHHNRGHESRSMGLSSGRTPA